MLKVFEMFSGYGGAIFALKKAGIKCESIGFSEIDKDAIKCYNKNFPNVKNYGDCTRIKVEELPDFDLLTGGFPCQPFSEAGKHLGEFDTRGTLFHDIIRIAEKKQPRYMVLENVKGLTFKTHKDTYSRILSELDRVGFNVFHKVMSSKNYGTPQSRERVIFVCINKKINEGYEFPKKENLEIFLKDLILENVDEKYFLKDTDRKFVKDKFPEKTIFNYSENDIVSVAIRNKNRAKHQSRGLPYGSFPIELHLRFNEEIGVSYTVKSAKHEFMIADINLNNIRYLTPKECFRLMGFFNDEINLEGISETAKYKLAGNGWDINLFSKIFLELLKDGHPN